MKQLTFVPEGGLCNRIYAITSAIHFAKKHDLLLKVYWFKDWGMGAGFHDLFDLSPDVQYVEIKDASWGDFYKYAKPIKSNFFLPYIYKKLKFDTIYYWYNEHISVEEWYLSNENANNFYLFHCQKFYDDNSILHIISPKDAIQKKIDERVKLLSPHTIGIHIRRTDFAELTKHSPLSVFIEKMREEIAIHPEVNFYVASDSFEEKEKLVRIFGDSIISVENILKRNTKEGIIDALIELFTLASTKKIYGSFQSSYSSLASEIKGIPLEIIKKDTK